MLATWAAAFALTALHYAGARWLAVLTVVLIDGGATLFWVLSAGALGAAALRGWRVRVSGALWVATAAALGLGLFGLICLGLGVLGALNRSTCLGLCTVSILLGAGPTAWRLRHRLTQQIDLPMPDLLRKPAGAWWLWLAAAPLAAVAVVGATLMPGLLWKPADPHPYDVLVYHLQVPREWFELGRIVELPHNIYAYFPFNVEIHNLAMMHLLGGPWAGMYAAQLLSVIFVIIAVIAIYAASQTIVGTVAAVVVPWTVMLGAVAYVEAGLIAFTAVAIAWVIRATREDLPRWPWIAGAMLGLACGVKWTAVAFVALPLIFAVIAILRKPRAAMLMALTCFVFVCPWLVRNFVWTGNPVFPVAMSVLGQGHYSDVQVERFALAHGPRPEQQNLSSRLSAGWKEILANGQYGYVLWPAALFCGAILWRDARARVLLFMSLAMLICWLFATHLMSRFYVTAIPVAAMLIGLLAANRFAKPVLAGCVCLLAGIAWLGFGRGGLHQKMDYFAREVGQRGVFGIDESGMAQFASPDLIRDLSKRRESVYLIGESQVFWFPLPMSRLKYRTVFDVGGDATTPALEAWTGLKDRPTDAIYFVNPDEYNRLQSTYWQIPPIPPEWAERREHFLIE